MRTRILLLAVGLAVMFGGTSALAQETDETNPEANTGFVATVSDTSIDTEAVDLESETLYIRYHVCSLNADADDACDGVLDEDFDPDTFDGWSEIAVEPNGAGEFNHGSFVSAFAKGHEGTGKGCILRFVAQSDWGKEGFDITGDDVLIQAETHCASNGKPGDGEVEGEGEGNGNRPAWAGQPGGPNSEAGASGGKPAWAGKPGGPKNTDD